MAWISSELQSALDKARNEQYELTAAIIKAADGDRKPLTDILEKVRAHE